LKQIAQVGGAKRLSLTRALRRSLTVLLLVLWSTQHNLRRLQTFGDHTQLQRVFRGAVDIDTVEWRVMTLVDGSDSGRSLAGDTQPVPILLHYCVLALLLY
jgi:hypothetical protein